MRLDQRRILLNHDDNGSGAFSPPDDLKRIVAASFRKWYQERADSVRRGRGSLRDIIVLLTKRNSQPAGRDGDHVTNSACDIEPVMSLLLAATAAIFCADKSSFLLVASSPCPAPTIGPVSVSGLSAVSQRSSPQCSPASWEERFLAPVGFPRSVGLPLPPPGLRPPPLFPGLPL